MDATAVASRACPGPLLVPPQKVARDHGPDPADHPEPQGLSDRIQVHEDGLLTRE